MKAAAPQCMIEIGRTWPATRKNALTCELVALAPSSVGGGGDLSAPVDAGDVSAGEGAVRQNMQRHGAKGSITSS